MHTAQGVTADTMHGLATGTESRQQLYTMMTRGAQANHVYLEVVGDGDPHSVIHPTLVRPLTPTDILESMLARDDAQQSATSMIREQADPRTRLGHAAQRYLDSLYVAAEDIAGTAVATAVDAAVEELLPGLADEPAWPALRAHLMLLGASGTDPVAALREAASDRELDTAGDRAAVLDWRLDASGMRNTAAGPLPWMPAVPTTLAEHPEWGSYLSQRADLVADLAGQVHHDATTSTQCRESARLGRERTATRREHDRRRRGMASRHGRRDQRPTPHRRTTDAEGARALAARPEPAPGRRPHPGVEGMAPPAARGRPAGPHRRVHSPAGRTPRRDVTRRPRRPPATPRRRRGRTSARRPRRGRTVVAHVAHLTPAVASQIGDGSHREALTATLERPARRPPRPRPGGKP